MSQRVILVVLDGYDPALGEELADAGAMPSLQRLRRRSARLDLDHGDARWTGLAGEHVSTGLSPDDARRWSAIAFDRTRYTVHQEGTRLLPFPARLGCRTVVFDPTYFDLAGAPELRGAVGWGGVHDPGAKPFARPAALAAEITARFGADPGLGWTYALPWPSPDRVRQMGRALTEAIALKTRVATWLLTERLPDWDLAILGIGEVHSTLEALWHGIDPAHPLAGVPSAAAAGETARAVYGAVDALLGTLAAACPDAAMVVTSLHGMGPNNSDLAAMALLPELLFRHAFGAARLSVPPAWAAAASALPLLGESGDWGGEVERAFVGRRQPAAPENHALEPPVSAAAVSAIAVSAIDWMPAAWYADAWPWMAAFALPAFYDGRIRFNLEGRESVGRVALRDYHAACDRVTALLEACRDLRTGAPAVDRIERAAPADPLDLAPTGCDLIVRWRGAPVGFDHPEHGRIGPLPYRRTGGHTGGPGVAYIAADGVAPGRHGQVSAFDLVPTVIDMLGVPCPPGLSGTSRYAMIRAPAGSAAGSAEGRAFRVQR
jgi:hypothetical protein